jgi:hypothetical protein
VGASLPARAVGAQVASGYTAGDTISCYQSSVSFLALHLSLYRGELGGSRYKYSHQRCKTKTESKRRLLSRVGL